MSEDPEKSENSQQEADIVPSQTRPPFFKKVDWLTFGATTLVALMIYTFTLIPSVSLENSGGFITAAMYAGVPHPPGYPLWTLWAWAFIKLLPIGNIAWRAGFATAVAGALACGLLSIMVSRGGEEILKQFSLSLKNYEEEWMLGICGFAAGIVFGFNSPLWSQIAIVTPWSLSILFLCIVLCLLMRWIYEPERHRYLCLAAFCYGLLLVNSQIHLAWLPAIPFLAAAGNEKVGRNFFLTGFLLFLSWIIADLLGIVPSVKSHGSGFLFAFIFLGVLAGLCGVALAVKTRRALSEWKTIGACSACFLCGLSLYLYSAIASMADPPMNWAYPRTVEGFVHLVSRGQYEELHPTDNFKDFARQLLAYFRMTGTYFGWPYLPVVLVPFLCLHRLGKAERKWILGLLASFVFLAFLMIIVLNPDRTMASNQGPWSVPAFVSSSYVVLSIWFGYGLILLGILLTKRPLSRHSS